MLENVFFLFFSWKFRVSWGVLKKSGLGRYIQLSVMCVCKYPNQRVKIIGEKNGKFFKGVSKTKKKKKHKEIKGTVMQIEKTLINDRLHVSKVS